MAMIPTISSVHTSPVAGPRCASSVRSTINAKYAVPATKVEIREINVEREDERFAVLSFLAVRTIFSYQNRDFKDETLFKGDIILKKIPRTMLHSQGLLIEEYREVLVKQLGQ